MNFKRNRIFLYDSVVHPDGQRGVNRYFLKFMEALVQTYTDRVLVYSRRKLDIPKQSRLWLPSSQKYIYKLLKAKQRYKMLDVFWAKQIADIQASLFYSPYFGHMRTKIPQSYTVPDMIYEKFPQYFSRSDRDNQDFIAEKRACLERASLIMPISNSTARDIQELYPSISPERMKVVYLGVDDLFFEPYAVPDDTRPYFLFVGNRDRYKNFLRLIDAYGKLGLQKDFDLRIISPVQNEFSADEKEVIERYKLGDCMHVEYGVSDIVLKRRYAEAYAFVYPTEYEGFGFPVVEALASGTIVLTSNRSSLPEVGGAAPLYFDPTSTDAIANALEVTSKISNTDRQERILMGKNWARQFTWEKSQRSFLAAIQEFLN